MKLLELDIITPEQILFEGKAQSVTVPGTKSPFQVLFNHAPIVSSLENGQIKIVDDNNKTILFKTTQGFIEVKSNKVNILVDSAEIETV